MATRICLWAIPRAIRACSAAPLAHEHNSFKRCPPVGYDCSTRPQPIGNESSPLRGDFCKCGQSKWKPERRDPSRATSSSSGWGKAALASSIAPGNCPLVAKSRSSQFCRFIPTRGSSFSDSRMKRTWLRAWSILTSFRFSIIGETRMGRTSSCAICAAEAFGTG